MVYEIRSSEKTNQLFENWDETIVWSALQGIMGKMYVTDPVNPCSAIIISGDFCFLAGLESRELACCESLWNSGGFKIMVPRNAEWERTIEEVYGERARRTVRYAMKKEKDVFDRRKLEGIVDALSGEYELQLIDEGIYDQCRASGWAVDLVSQFENYEAYKQLGLGIAVLKDGTIVSGASSYSRYKDGIEIEIDTRENYRRMGLASVCGAKLILECQERKLYPSWDAQNLWSVALAEKLGYHFSHEYTAYEVWNSSYSFTGCTG